jgi:hypothetical protein
MMQEVQPAAMAPPAGERRQAARPPAIEELRRARRGMVRHLRRFFERAAVLQVSGDARRPKGMSADLRGDAGGQDEPRR